MSLISFEQRRKTNLWFNIFVDVREYGWAGVFKMQNEKWYKTQSKNNSTREPNRMGTKITDRNGRQLVLWGE